METTTERVRLHEKPSQIENQHAKIIMSAEDICYSYDGGHQILKGVNVEFTEGLMTMMLGRSGSGKTTFLKILAGLQKQAGGKILFDGSDQKPPKTKGLAYIPQNLGLVRNLTAMDNVLIGALGYTDTAKSLMKHFSDEVYGKAQKILSDLKISHLRNKKIWNLSGGERQRIAIARALIQDPRIILADEFVSQLDPVTATEILAIMKELTLDKIAFVITTHDVDLVRKYADHLIILKDGKISREACPVVLLADEIFEELK